MAYRPSAMKYKDEKEAKGDQHEDEDIDPSQPYEFKFKILAEYMQKY